MSDEMAVGDKANIEESKVNGDDAAAGSSADVEMTNPEAPSELAPGEDKEESISAEITTEASTSEDQPITEEKPTSIENQSTVESTHSNDNPVSTEQNNKQDVDDDKRDDDKHDDDDKHNDDDKHDDADKRGVKRRASDAFSDNVGDSEVFKGFGEVDSKDLSMEYGKVLERLEAEVSAASTGFTPVRTVMATPPAPPRASKRQRQDTGKSTDGSRPSSALSSRSEGEFADIQSPASHRNRRATTEMSSPLLRIPLERGWKRELVYRAINDSATKRNADIYYYTPQGKKLRSSREVSEYLAGTGLTLENFSFFKEPLGVDDPEKEIIRDAKLLSRRLESPVRSPAPALAEGKRAHKPKPPKGASPEPAIKSPPAKIKVKSLGSRLSASTPASTPKQKKAPSADNNNTAAAKKPRPSTEQEAIKTERQDYIEEPDDQSDFAIENEKTESQDTSKLHDEETVVMSVEKETVGTSLLTQGVQNENKVASGVGPTSPPPPLKSRPDAALTTQGGSAACSLSCGRGVPTLACVACLCLYHPACVAPLYKHVDGFLCKNCRKPPSPSAAPPPLAHKSGVTSLPRRPLQPKDKRVTLRMKVSGGTSGRVWSVSPAPAPAPPPPPPRPRALALRSALPQSLATINGRKFIIVPRAIVHNAPCEPNDTRRRSRVNGAAPPAPVASPRRRGRARNDDTDHFTGFYKAAQENNYNVVVQIFQYLGMRDLAHCARVCKLWKELAATPALWKYVRMKNSHVSDWGGLCAALQRRGTRRLDLRKMLLPQNDKLFWEHFCKHIGIVDTLETIEMCRCPAAVVEALCRRLPGLRALAALAIRDATLDPAPLAALPRLRELRLKSLAGLTLSRDLAPLAALTQLTHLSLTSIKELGWCACDVVGQLSQLQSLELGECSFDASFGAALRKLTQLRRLRLERGTAQCAAPDILRALASLPALASLELVNVDVKVGFDDALAECKNIQRLLIIPTYVSQSATTNKQVLSGVLRLKDSLTHLMWGVTIELLRVTELFIDQCERAAAGRRDAGECIPVLKPVPGCRLPLEHHHVAGPPQVEILPLPTLQRLLSAQLPNTKLKLLRIPFHATWRQSLADFQ